MRERITAASAGFVNAHTNPPMVGASVLGLTRGGKLIELNWSKDSINFIDATCAYPKIPEDVKILQSNRWAKLAGIEITQGETE